MVCKRGIDLGNEERGYLSFSGVGAMCERNECIRIQVQLVSYATYNIGVRCR